MTTPICEGSKSYLTEVRLFWLFALDKGDNAYMRKIEILFGQAKCNYFSKEVRLFWLFASDKGDDAYMRRLEILFG